MSLNRVILVGRLVRDPELRATPSGTNVANVSVAVDKKIKPKDPAAPTADFFRVSVFGQAAQFISDYGSKGRLVSVDGRIESRKYTDKEGVLKEVWEVIADNVSLLDRPKDDAPGGGGGQTRTNASDPLPDEYDPFAED
jgi:single-strand DNA-binding protein